MIRVDRVEFDDFDIDQGDLVDFGEEGQFYVNGCQGVVTYLKVTDNPDDRYNSRAKGKLIHHQYAMRIIEKGERHVEEFTDKLQRAHKMVLKGRFEEAVDYIFTNNDARYIVMYLVKVLKENEELLEYYRNNTKGKKVVGVDY